MTEEAQSAETRRSLRTANLSKPNYRVLDASDDEIQSPCEPLASLCPPPTECPSWLEPFFRKHFETLSAQIEKSIEFSINKAMSEMKETVRRLEQNVESLQSELKTLHEEVKTLKGKEKKSERNKLVQEAEQLSNNIILGGTAVPLGSQSEVTVQTAHNIIKSCCKLNIPSHNITKAYRFGKPPTQGEEDTRRIKLCLSNASIKRDIIIASIKLRGFESNGLYINEELSQDTNTLFYKLRTLKKAHSDKITTVNTRNGIIRVKTINNSEAYEILTKEDYNNFLARMDIPNP